MYGSVVWNETRKTYDKRQEKSRALGIERMRTDALLLMKTLSVTPRPWYHWNAETLSFLHVYLAWGVNLASLLNKRRQSWKMHSKQTYAEILAKGP